MENLPTGIGVVSGMSLLSCLSTALIFPAVAGQAFAAGSVFGIISITNVWVGAHREDTSEWMRGMRGFGYTIALLVSLIAELARLQGMAYLPMPHLSGIPDYLPVPSAMTTQLIAVLLIIIDPLIVKPLVKWLANGAERAPYAEQDPA
jgi:hypothetical protein